MASQMLKSVLLQENEMFHVSVYNTFFFFPYVIWRYLISEIPAGT